MSDILDSLTKKVLGGEGEAAPKKGKAKTVTQFKNYRDISRWAEERNFTVTSTTGGKHNVGSAHFNQRAVDVRTRDKTPSEIERLMQEAEETGVLHSRDERVRPPGQKEWGGPHLHLQIGGSSGRPAPRVSVIDEVTSKILGGKGKAPISNGDSRAKPPQEYLDSVKYIKSLSPIKGKASSVDTSIFDPPAKNDTWSSKESPYTHSLPVTDPFRGKPADNSNSFLGNLDDAARFGRDWVDRARTSVTNAIPRSIDNAVGSLIQAPGVLIDAISGPSAATEKIFLGPGRTVKQEGERIFPKQPGFEDSFLGEQVPEAIGSTVPFMLAGGASKAAGALPWLSAAISGLTGMGVQAGDTYESALGYGADKQEAATAAIKTAPIGALDAVFPEFLLNKMASKGLPKAKMLREILVQSQVEGGTEAIQQGWENYIAQGSYDKNRNITDNVLEAYKVGAFTGGLFTASGHFVDTRNPQAAAHPDVVSAPVEGVGKPENIVAGPSAKQTQGEPVEIGGRKGYQRTHPQLGDYVEFEDGERIYLEQSGNVRASAEIKPVDIKVPNDKITFNFNAKAKLAETRINNEATTTRGPETSLTVDSVENNPRAKWNNHAWDYAQIAARDIHLGIDNWFEKLQAEHPEITEEYREELERRARRLTRGGLKESLARVGRGAKTRLIKLYSGTGVGYHQPSPEFKGGEGNLFGDGGPDSVDHYMTDSTYMSGTYANNSKEEMGVSAETEEGAIQRAKELYGEGEYVVISQRPSNYRGETKNYFTIEKVIPYGPNVRPYYLDSRDPLKLGDAKKAPAEFLRRINELLTKIGGQVRKKGEDWWPTGANTDILPDTTIEGGDEKLLGEIATKLGLYKVASGWPNRQQLPTWAEGIDDNAISTPDIDAAAEVLLKMRDIAEATNPPLKYGLVDSFGEYHLRKFQTRTEADAFKSSLPEHIRDEFDVTQLETKPLEDHLLHHPDRLNKTVSALARILGYDALNHTGGKALGGRNHDVWIAFNSEQIIPAHYADSTDISLKELIDSNLEPTDDPDVKLMGRVMAQMFEPVLTGEAAMGSVHARAGEISPYAEVVDALLPIIDQYVADYAEEKGKKLNVIRFEEPDPYGDPIIDAYIVNFDKITEILNSHNIGESPESFINRSRNTTFKEGTPERGAISEMFNYENKINPPKVKEARARIEKGIYANESPGLPTNSLEEFGREIYNPLISSQAWMREVTREFQGTPDLIYKAQDLWHKLREEMPSQPLPEETEEVLDLPNEQPRYKIDDMYEEIQGAAGMFGGDRESEGLLVISKNEYSTEDPDNIWTSWKGEDVATREKIASSPRMQRLAGHLNRIADVVAARLAEGRERQFLDKATELTSYRLHDSAQHAVVSARSKAAQYKEAKFGGFTTDPAVFGLNYHHSGKGMPMRHFGIGTIFINPFSMARAFFALAHINNINPAWHAGVMASSIITTIVHEITHQEASGYIAPNETPRSYGHSHGETFENAWQQTVELTMQLSEELEKELSQILDPETLKEVGQYARELYRRDQFPPTRRPGSFRNRYYPLIEKQRRAEDRVRGGFEGGDAARDVFNISDTEDSRNGPEAAGSPEPPPGEPTAKKVGRRFLVRGEWVGDTYKDGEPFIDPQTGQQQKKVQFSVIDSSDGKVRGTFTSFAEAQKGADSLEKSAAVKGEEVGKKAPKDEENLDRAASDYELLVDIYKAKKAKNMPEMIRLVKEAKDKGIDPKRISSASMGKSPWVGEAPGGTLMEGPVDNAPEEGDIQEASPFSPDEDTPPFPTGDEPMIRKGKWPSQEEKGKPAQGDLFNKGPERSANIEPPPSIDDTNESSPEPQPEDLRPKRPDLTEPQITQNIHKTFYKLAGDLLERKGIKRDKSVTMMEQTRRVLMNSKAEDLLDINRYLASKNIDLASFMLGLAMPTSSDAGRFLNTLSQVAKQIGEVERGQPEFAQELERIRKSQETWIENHQPSLYKRWVGIFKGAMVATWATASRNAASQGARLGVDILTDAVDGSIQAMRGKDVSGRAEAVHPLDGLEVFMRLGTEGKVTFKQGVEKVKGKLGMATKGAPVSVADQLLSVYPVLKDRLYQEFLSDVDTIQAKLRPRGTITEKATYKIENAIQALNALNIAQEYTVRRAVFVARMFQEARNRKIDLHKIIETNDRKTMEALPREMWEASLDKALDASFAAEPQSSLGKVALHAIRAIQNSPFGLLMPFANPIDSPFPRFLINALRFHYEYSPLSIPELILPTKARADIANGDTKRVGKVAVGIAMLGLAYAMAAHRKDDERWYEFYGVDTRAFNPFAGYLFLGDMMYRKINGKEFDYTPREAMTAILAMGSRSDTNLDIASRIGSMLTEEDPEYRSVGQHTAEYVGDALSRFFHPATTVKDIYASTFDKWAAYITGHGGNEDVLRDTKFENPLIAPTYNKFPGISQFLPEVETPLRDKAPRQQSPWAKQVFGARFTEPKNPLESEATRNSFKFKEIFTSTGDVDFDREMTHNMGQISEEFMDTVNSNEFKALPQEERAYILSEYLRAIRAAARAKTNAANPDKYLEFRHDDLPKRERKLLDSLPQRPASLSP